MDRPRIRVFLGDAEAVEADVVIRPGRRQHASGRIVTIAAPTWPGPDPGRRLAEAYRDAVRAANDRRARTMVLPAVLARSPWPLDDVTRVALTVLGSTPTSLCEVMIAARTPAMVETWAEAITREPPRWAPRSPR